jgi:hypothetical protein
VLNEAASEMAEAIQIVNAIAVEVARNQPPTDLLERLETIWKNLEPAVRAVPTHPMVLTLQQQLRHATEIAEVWLTDAAQTLESSLAQNRLRKMYRTTDELPSEG